jgi:hypothetical protein
MSPLSLVLQRDILPPSFMCVFPIRLAQGQNNHLERQSNRSHVVPAKFRRKSMCFSLKTRGSSFPMLSQILPKNAMKTARTAKRVAVPGIAWFVILLFFWTYSSRFHRPLSVEGEGTSGAENHDNGPQPEDKILVMAKMETENTDWVMENLPEYCPILTPISYSQLKFLKLATCHISHGRPDIQIPCPKEQRP